MDRHYLDSTAKVGLKQDLKQLEDILNGKAKVRLKRGKVLFK